ncbi:MULTISPECIES: LytTR family transcriptional regulator DNA-binding domain-containing protein [Lysinibacillus]|uniref:LytTR family transcriptional regulator DNA-binding domain-containing protein n=1 Tax=Lysinibacillus TaxID=400634 RepID=UPI001C8B989F|nr:MULTISPECIES: LytTR family transcriptional regulator DNA-binding domain-containing protein [Lysinibacillus]MBX8942337.1 ABC transporter ATP-binding protein [Lysinibacillus sp. K60]UNT55298.1 LytTR family transcriptional regulator DNA-binding domain-containing protein [Lysinibacillus capsici]WDU79861.1 LytTR family transcriptional regulator DNA-binding domain-containing protein [Lysinibacillus sp. G01H]WHP40226.1 LytTR family transcriptional regulator DNA-binding domain-containing protein [Ly
MEQNIDIQVDPYIEAGNVIYPSFHLSLQSGMIIGIYTDVSKIHTLMQWFMKRDDTYTSFRESALYERLTAREYIQFILKLFNRPANETENILKLFKLTEQNNNRISKLSNSEKQRLKLLNMYLHPTSIQIIEEPFQNIDEFSKQTIQQLLKNLSKERKIIILLSNNLEDLMVASTTIYRLDGAALHALDVKEGSLEQAPRPLENAPIRLDKIPTKKNDKIILFNPPEIDYIESVEGEVSIYVAGEAYPCTLSLNELEQKLTPFGFFRSHRSYIVNLQKVREIITWTRNSYSLALNSTEKTVVPLSKNKLATLKEILGI